MEFDAETLLKLQNLSPEELEQALTEMEEPVDDDFEDAADAVQVELDRVAEGLEELEARRVVVSKFRARDIGTKKRPEFVAALQAHAEGQIIVARAMLGVVAAVQANAAALRLTEEDVRMLQNFRCFRALAGYLDRVGEAPLPSAEIDLMRSLVLNAIRGEPTDNDPLCDASLIIEVEDGPFVDLRTAIDGTIQWWLIYFRYQMEADFGDFADRYLEVIPQPGRNWYDAPLPTAILGDDFPLDEYKKSLRKKPGSRDE